MRLVLPSVLGAIAFLIPVPYEGSYTITLAILNDLLADFLKPYLPLLLVVILLASALGSLAIRFVPARLRARWPELDEVFQVGLVWLLLRIAAVILAVAIVWQIGPELVWGESTGQVVFYQLAISIVTLFALAAFLIPLLTEYGLMDVVGVFLSPLFRRWFTLPGRAAVDASASWFAAAAVGILITSKQYVGGFYSAREACVIATNFSIVSLPFCLLIATVLGIEERFFQFYLILVVVGIVAAVVLPRLPPLSRVPDKWTGPPPVAETVDGNLKTLWRYGLAQGRLRAIAAPLPGAYLRQALFNMLEVWFGLLPGVIVVGLFGLVLAEHTNLAGYLSWPLIPVLDALRLPEAQAAAPTMILGFAEMFLPAALGQDISSELTRFVVAGVSISQLIYMSEVGILVLRSPIPLGFIDLVLIFLWRTAIALPLFALAGHLMGLS